VTRLLVVVPSPSGPPARLGEWLAAAGLELDERAAGADLPATLDGFDGLLVLGGPQTSHEPEAAHPELIGVRALLRQAIDGDVPTLAICLGAQLLAQAGGGRSRRGTEGPEVGPQLVAKRDAADADPLFGPLPMTPDVLQWHHDEISQLPDGATLLASSPVYAHQAYRIGRHVYGLQFHIETAPEVACSWADEDPEGLASTPFDRETMQRRIVAAHPDFEEVWAPFAARFADLVRGAARRAA
jgi:GMP synthase (glutamine-hydrolysing)